MFPIAKALPRLTDLVAIPENDSVNLVAPGHPAIVTHSSNLVGDTETDAAASSRRKAKRGRDRSRGDRRDIGR